MASIIGDIFGVGGIGDAIKGITGIINELVPDSNLKEKGRQAAEQGARNLAQKVADYAEAKATAEIDLLKAQSAIDIEEAKSNKLFVAGWRPFTGWAASATFILLSFALLLATWLKIDVSLYMQVYWTLGSLLTSMLGLRTFERYHGIADGSNNDPAPRAQPMQAQPSFSPSPSVDGRLPRA
jgi:hypothetical protein